MTVFYLILSIVMWILIGFGVYKLIQSVVRSVKKIMNKRKEVKENAENQQH